jgi:hypothetical protein
MLKGGHMADVNEHVHSPMAKYVILTGGYLGLMEQVRLHIDDGWIPQGGLAIHQSLDVDGNPVTRFYQAMVHPDYLTLAREQGWIDRQG